MKRNRILILGFLLLFFIQLNSENTVLTIFAPKPSQEESNDPSIINFKQIKIKIGEEATIKLITQTNYTSIKITIEMENVIIYNQVSMNFVEKFYENYTWEYDLDTSSFFGTPMEMGSYNIRFDTIDYEGNYNYYKKENILLIYEPATPLNPFIIVGIVVGIIAILVVIIILKRRTEYEYIDDEPVKLQKKREIYTGASKIGKMDGQAAETMLAKRRKQEYKALQPRSEKFQSSKKSKSTKSDSEKVIPSSLRLKMEESKLDSSKKMQFLESKIDSLDSQVEILRSIVSMMKDIKKCPNCGNEVSLDWEICPFCKIEEYDSKIKPIEQINTNKKVCEKCGTIIETNWKSCPQCLINSKK